MSRPSELLRQYLSGQSIEDKAVKSWAQFFIYKKAEEVLRLPFAERRAVIEASPLPGELGAEVVRLNKLRQLKKPKTDAGQGEMF